MACMFINNLISCNTEIELVKKFDQIGNHKMINFIDTRQISGKSLFLNYFLKRNQYFKAIIEYDNQIDHSFIELVNARVQPMVVVVAKYKHLGFEERKLNLIKSVSYFKLLS